MAEVEITHGCLKAFVFPMIPCDGNLGKDDTELTKALSQRYA